VGKPASGSRLALGLWAQIEEAGAVEEVWSEERVVSDVRRRESRLGVKPGSCRMRNGDTKTESEYTWKSERDRERKTHRGEFAQVSFELANKPSSPPISETVLPFPSRLAGGILFLLRVLHLSSIRVSCHQSLQDLRSLPASSCSLLLVRSLVGFRRLAALAKETATAVDGADLEEGEDARPERDKLSRVQPRQFRSRRG
jgi:hypothetical protein